MTWADAHGAVQVRLVPFIPFLARDGGTTLGQPPGPAQRLLCLRRVRLVAGAYRVRGGVGLAGSSGSGNGVRWRVFLSHTSELREFPRRMSYVAAAERAISAAGHVIVDMADFPAADQTPRRYASSGCAGARYT
jgi:hypothetical protein